MTLLCCKGNDIGNVDNDTLEGSFWLFILLKSSQCDESLLLNSVIIQLTWMWISNLGNFIWNQYMEVPRANDAQGKVTGIIAVVCLDVDC